MCKALGSIPRTTYIYTHNGASGVSSPPGAAELGMCKPFSMMSPQCCVGLFPSWWENNSWARKVYYYVWESCLYVVQFLRSSCIFSYIAHRALALFLWWWCCCWGLIPGPFTCSTSSLTLCFVPGQGLYSFMFPFLTVSSPREEAGFVLIHETGAHDEEMPHIDAPGVGKHWVLLSVCDCWSADFPQ